MSVCNAAVAAMNTKVKEEDKKFIDSVCQFPNLYNKKLKEYRDLDKALTTWKAIGATCGKDWKECKQKWRKLRDAYVKVKKNEYRKTKGGEIAEKHTNWPHYDSMSFLEEHIRHKEVAETDLTDNSNDDTLEFEVDNEHRALCNEGASGSSVVPLSIHIGQNISESSKDLLGGASSSSEDSPRAKKSKRMDIVEMAILESLAHVRPRMDTNEDEDELFGKMIAATLKKFGPREKALCKFKIQQVLFEQEELNFSGAVTSI